MRPKGSIKTPGSGRVKGTPNKKTGELIERIKQSGKTALEVMIEFLNHADDSLRFSAAKELLQYEHPKRKAVEHTVLSKLTKVVKRLDGSEVHYTNGGEEE